MQSPAKASPAKPSAGVSPRAGGSASVEAEKHEGVVARSMRKSGGGGMSQTSSKGSFGASTSKSITPSGMPGKQKTSEEPSLSSISRKAIGWTNSDVDKKVHSLTSDQKLRRSLNNSAAAGSGKKATPLLSMRSCRAPGGSSGSIGGALSRRSLGGPDSMGSVSRKLFGGMPNKERSTAFSEGDPDVIEFDDKEDTESIEVAPSGEAMRNIDGSSRSSLKHRLAEMDLSSDDEFADQRSSGGGDGGKNTPDNLDTPQSHSQHQSQPLAQPKDAPLSREQIIKSALAASRKAGEHLKEYEEGEEEEENEAEEGEEEEEEERFGDQEDAGDVQEKEGIRERLISKSMGRNKSAKKIKSMGRSKSTKIGHSNMLSMIASVEEHKDRIEERMQVITGLKNWTDDVLIKRNPASQLVNEHVDADQLDLGDEGKRANTADPTGVGAALRLHWETTVDEEVERRIGKLKEEWEEQQTLDADELIELRKEIKVLQDTNYTYKEQFLSMKNKVDMLQRKQRKSTGGAEAPADDTADGEPALEEGLPLGMDDSEDMIMNVSRLKSELEESTNQAAALSERMAESEAMWELERKSLSAKVEELKCAPAGWESEKADLQFQLHAAKDELEQANTSTSAVSGNQEAPEQSIGRSSPSTRSKTGSPDRKGRSTLSSPTKGPSSPGQTARGGGDVAAKIKELNTQLKALGDELSSKTEEASQLRKAMQQGLKAPPKTAAPKSGSLPTPAASAADQSSPASPARVSAGAAASAGDGKELGNALAAAAAAESSLNNAREYSDCLSGQVESANKKLEAATEQVATLEDEVAKLTDKLTKQRERTESVMNVPAGQLQVEIEIERNARLALITELEDGFDAILSTMIDLAANCNSNADAMMQVVEDEARQLRLFVESLANKYDPEVVQEGGKEGQGQVKSVSQRKVMGKAELQGLLANSSAKLKELYEMGGAPVVPGQLPAPLRYDGGFSNSGAHPQRRSRSGSIMNSMDGSGGPPARMRMSLAGISPRLAHGLSRSSNPNVDPLSRQGSQSNLPVADRATSSPAIPTAGNAQGYERRGSSSGVPSLDLSLVSPMGGFLAAQGQNFRDDVAGQDGPESVRNSSRNDPGSARPAGTAPDQHQLEAAVRGLAVDQAQDFSFMQQQQQQQQQGAGPAEQAGSGRELDLGAVVVNKPGYAPPSLMAAEALRDIADGTEHDAGGPSHISRNALVIPASVHTMDPSTPSAQRPAASSNPNLYPTRPVGSFENHHAQYFPPPAQPGVSVPWDASQAPPGDPWGGGNYHQENSVGDYMTQGGEVGQAANSGLVTDEDRESLGQRGKRLPSQQGLAGSNLRPRSPGEQQEQQQQQWQQQQQQQWQQQRGQQQGPGGPEQLLAGGRSGLAPLHSWSPPHGSGGALVPSLRIAKKMGLQPRPNSAAAHAGSSRAATTKNDAFGSGGRFLEPPSQLPRIHPASLSSEGISWQPLGGSMGPGQALYSHSPPRGGADRQQSPDRSVSPDRGRSTHLGVLEDNGAGWLAASADQLPDSFHVRTITATPQKGFKLDMRGRPNSAHSRMMTNYDYPPSSPERQQNPRPMSGLSHASPGSFLGWQLEPGQGPPQIDPGPLPIMSTNVNGYTMGLSVPQQGMQLQLDGAPSGAAPAGGVLSFPGDDQASGYSALHLMTRAELVKHARHLQKGTETALRRHKLAMTDLEKVEFIREELADEVTDAREHWMAENTFNALLQEELDRMQNILRMVHEQKNLNIVAPLVNPELRKFRSKIMEFNQEVLLEESSWPQSKQTGWPPQPHAS